MCKNSWQISIAGCCGSRTECFDHFRKKPQIRLIFKILSFLPRGVIVKLYKHVEKQRNMHVTPKLKLKNSRIFPKFLH